ncbi:MAG: acyl carrier protein [Acholeplasmatales bacterium]|jgi:acyl carrier protein|nr:acyl carrier protein [Acholeplasmatales bacterium]
MANKTVSFEEIKKMIIECANVSAEITPESVLKTDLGFDSIYAVEMILELEEHFGIKIEINEMDTMMTVADVVKVVEKKLRG